MRLLRKRVLARSAIATTAGIALVVPFTSPASAEAAYAITALPALDASEYVTVDAAQQAPTLTTSVTGTVDPNYLLATPAAGFSTDGSGIATIYNNQGQVIYQRPGNFLNFQQFSYQGTPILVTFDMRTHRHIILDQSYTQVGSVGTGNGRQTEGHDIDFTEDGSRALVSANVPTPANGTNVLNVVIQEIEVATGAVLWEWSALDHVPVSESTDNGIGGFGNGDIYHLNSLTYDSDGNVLTSFRNTSTVYKIDRTSGEIIWRLGGVNSDFAGTSHRYQHDAKRRADGTISMLDNGTNTSRGLAYRLDETAMTATVAQELRPNPPVFAQFMGNNFPASNGNQLVGFGSAARLAEFANGQQVMTGSFGGGGFGAASYRVERTNGWTGTPAAPPAVVVGDADADGSRTVHVSWNGATDVAGWTILAGPSENDLVEVGTVKKTGFETAAEITAPDADVFRVVAVDSRGGDLRSHTLSVD